jgi:hypothetical protein
MSKPKVLRSIDNNPTPEAYLRMNNLVSYVLTNSTTITVSNLTKITAGSHILLALGSGTYTSVNTIIIGTTSYAIRDISGATTTIPIDISYIEFLIYGTYAIILNTKTNKYLTDQNTVLTNKFTEYLPTTGTAAKASQDASGNVITDTYLPKAGGTMTGALTLSGAPTTDLHAATKAYVDTAVSGVMSSSLAQNGYIKFGNGVLVQWGICTIGTTVSFPITFSSTNYSVIVTPNGDDGSGYQNTRVPTKNKASFYVNGANWSSGNWVAIGY